MKPWLKTISDAHYSVCLVSWQCSGLGPAKASKTRRLQQVSAKPTEETMSLQEPETGIWCQALSAQSGINDSDMHYLIGLCHFGRLRLKENARKHTSLELFIQGSAFYKATACQLKACLFISSPSGHPLLKVIFLVYKLILLPLSQVIMMRWEMSSHHRHIHKNNHRSTTIYKVETPPQKASPRFSADKWPLSWGRRRICPDWETTWTLHLALL